MDREAWTVQLRDDFDAAMREAKALAKGEHAARLRGRRHRAFDDQGIHPFSQAIGGARLLVKYLTMVGVEANVDPVGVWAAGRADAEEEFVKAVADHGRDVFTEARAAR